MALSAESPLPRWSAVAMGALAMMCAVFPVFLVGAQASAITADLELNEARLGTMLSLFFVASGITARAAARTVERRGWAMAMALASAASGTSLLATAVFGRNLWVVGAFLGIGGYVQSLAIPAANELLVRGFRGARRGLAFGVVQGAGTAAGMVIGLALSTITVRYGWRSTIAAAAIFPTALGVLTLASRRQVTEQRVRPTAVRARSTSEMDDRMSLLIVAGGIGAAVAATLAAFVVTSATSTGMSAGAAGTLLTLGNAVALMIRVFVGWASDRGASWDVTRALAALMSVGALGCLMLAQGSMPGLIAGVVLAHAGGCSWPSVFHLALIRARPDAAPAASAKAVIGFAVGATLGPAGFGWIAHLTSRTAAWTAIAISASCAAAAAWNSSSPRRRRRRRRTVSPSSASLTAPSHASNLMERSIQHRIAGREKGMAEMVTIRRRNGRTALLVQELHARAAIHDALMRYCRGVDRLDPELICSAYHADAIDEHGPYRYTGATVGPAIVERLSGLSASLHMIANELVRLQGPSVAVVESYFTMWMVRDTDDGEQTQSGFGRYLDTFESRHGNWRIAHRIALLEWDQLVVQSPGSDTGLERTPGCRTHDDPSIHLFGPSAART